MRDDDEAARAYTGGWCAHGDIRYADLPASRSWRGTEGTMDLIVPRAHGGRDGTGTGDGAAACPVAAGPMNLARGPDLY